MIKDIVYTIIIFVLVILLLVTNLKNIKNLTGFVVEEIDKNFSIYTKAVCDNNITNTFCRDHMFIKCGSSEYVLPTNASIIHNSSWEDPRT